jgi:hypothetical protein
MSNSLPSAWPPLSPPLSPLSSVGYDSVEYTIDGSTCELLLSIMVLPLNECAGSGLLGVAGSTYDWLLVLLLPLCWLMLLS